MVQGTNKTQAVIIHWAICCVHWTPLFQYQSADENTERHRMATTRQGIHVCVCSSFHLCAATSSHLPFVLQICSSISRDDCVWVLSHLQALRNFLEKNTQFSVSGVT